MFVHDESVAPKPETWVTRFSNRMDSAIRTDASYSFHFGTNSRVRERKFSGFSRQARIDQKVNWTCAEAPVNCRAPSVACSDYLLWEMLARVVNSRQLYARTSEQFEASNGSLAQRSKRVVCRSHDWWQRGDRTAGEGSSDVFLCVFYVFLPIPASRSLTGESPQKSTFFGKNPPKPGVIFRFLFAD